MAKPLRCAIYTRKSSEEGLEQDFNSLHAQREACEAYVRSQAGEGWAALATPYDDGHFNTQVAKHLFCKTCGVKAFYIPRSHPDGISVNARCIDAGSIESMTVIPFDGRNWEKGRAQYRAPDA